MMKRQPFLVILCVLVAWLAGCGSSRQAQFYTLSPVPAPAAAPLADCSVSVGPVSVPDVVDRQQIVIRTGPNQVIMDEFNRWASPLRGDIARVVAENLVSMLGTPQITVFPQTSAVGADYRVAVDVLRFDSAPGGAATLDALWTIRSSKPEETRSGRTSVSEPAQGGGYNALVAAHSRALGKMSTDIATTIREMQARPK
jgi:uncharacterized protein